MRLNKNEHGSGVDFEFQDDIAELPIYEQKPDKK